MPSNAPVPFAKVQKSDRALRRCGHRTDRACGRDAPHGAGCRQTKRRQELTPARDGTTGLRPLRPSFSRLSRYVAPNGKAQPPLRCRNLSKWNRSRARSGRPDRGLGRPVPCSYEVAHLWLELRLLVMHAVTGEDVARTLPLAGVDELQ